MIPVFAYLAVSAGLFSIGVYGILTTRSSIKLLMCVELLINSAHLNFAAFASYHRMWAASSSSSSASGLPRPRRPSGSASSSTCTGSRAPRT